MWLVLSEPIMFPYSYILYKISKWIFKFQQHRKYNDFLMLSWERCSSGFILYWKLHLQRMLKYRFTNHHPRKCSWQFSISYSIGASKSPGNQTACLWGLRWHEAASWEPSTRPGPLVLKVSTQSSSGHWSQYNQLGLSLQWSGSQEEGKKGRHLFCDHDNSDTTSPVHCNHLRLSSVFCT